MADDFEFSLAAPRRPPVPRVRPGPLREPGSSALNARVSAATSAATRGLAPAAAKRAPASAATAAAAEGDFASRLAARVREQALELAQRDRELAAARGALAERDSELAQLRGVRFASESTEFESLEVISALRAQVEAALGAADEARRSERRALAERDQLLDGRARLDAVLGAQSDELRGARAALADATAARDAALGRLEAAMDGRAGAAAAAERSGAAVAEEARSAAALRAELAGAQTALANSRTTADGAAAETALALRLARELCASDAQWTAAARQRWYPDGQGAAGGARARARLGAPLGSVAADGGRGGEAADGLALGAAVRELRARLLARTVAADALSAELAAVEAAADAAAADARVERGAMLEVRAQLVAATNAAETEAAGARLELAAARADARAARGRAGEVMEARAHAAEAAAAAAGAQRDRLLCEVAAVSDSQRCAEGALEQSRRLLLAHARAAQAVGGGGERLPPPPPGALPVSALPAAEASLLVERARAALAQLLRAADRATRALAQANAGAAEGEGAAGETSGVEAAAAVPAAARRLLAAVRAAGEREGTLRTRLGEAMARSAVAEEALAAERAAKRADTRAADSELRHARAHVAELQAALHSASLVHSAAPSRPPHHAGPHHRVLCVGAHEPESDEGGHRVEAGYRTRLRLDNSPPRARAAARAVCARANDTSAAPPADWQAGPPLQARAPTAAILGDMLGDREEGGGGGVGPEAWSAAGAAEAVVRAVPESDMRSDSGALGWSDIRSGSESGAHCGAELASTTRAATGAAAADDGRGRPGAWAPGFAPPAHAWAPVLACGYYEDMSAPRDVRNGWGTDPREALRQESERAPPAASEGYSMHSAHAREAQRQAHAARAAEAAAAMHAAASARAQAEALAERASELADAASRWQPLQPPSGAGFRNLASNDGGRGAYDSGWGPAGPAYAEAADYAMGAATDAWVADRRPQPGALGKAARLYGLGPSAGAWNPLEELIGTSFDDLLVRLRKEDNVFSAETGGSAGAREYVQVSLGCCRMVAHPTKRMQLKFNPSTTRPSLQHAIVHLVNELIATHRCR
ncbi:hypothetical protein T492DRAFT_918037, partial [Pavlovales sp. CCMP2436]